MSFSLLIEQGKGYSKKIPLLGNILLAIKKGLDGVLNMIEYNTTSINIEGQIISGSTYRYDGYDIFFPKENSDMRYIIREIFENNILGSLQGCECILDLGAYLGESSIYLSKYNSKVIAVEANPESYIIAKHNINQLSPDKIILINGYISKEFSNIGRSIIAKGCGSKIDNNSIGPIQAINYNSLIKDYKPDGIKMDIEGGEYPIIKGILQTRDFVFKKGFIEFHELYNKDNQRLLRDFLQFLEDRDYIFKTISNKNQIINMDKNLPPVINVLFHQQPS